jgi:hypothetical protein
MPDLGVIADKPLSKGHLMKTEAHLRASDGLLVGQTMTRSVVLLGGFHGAVQAFIANADGEVIASSQQHTYGVDGVLVGQHTRTDVWSQTFGPEVGANAREIVIVHSWDPQWASAIANTARWIATLIDLIASSGKGNTQTGQASPYPPTAPWTPTNHVVHRSRGGDLEGDPHPGRERFTERPAPVPATIARRDVEDDDGGELAGAVAVRSIDDHLWTDLQ